jgi:hypothetical protein
VLLDCGLDDAELRDEARRQRNACLRESSTVMPEREERVALAEPAEQSEAVFRVAGAAHRADRPRTTDDEHA